MIRLSCPKTLVLVLENAENASQSQTCQQTTFKQKGTKLFHWKGSAKRPNIPQIAPFCCKKANLPNRACFTRMHGTPRSIRLFIINGRKTNNKLKVWWPKMACLGPPFWPRNFSRKKFMWVHFWRCFPGNEAHKLFSGGPEKSVLGGGQKVCVLSLSLNNSVCLQFRESLFAISVESRNSVWGPFNTSSRGNPSLCCLRGG